MLLPITKADLARLIDLSLPDAVLDDSVPEQPQVSGLKDFILKYNQAKHDVVDVVLDRWNRSAAIYTDAAVLDMAESGAHITFDNEHTQTLAGIHKAHLRHLLDTVALLEYRATVMLRYHASLVARVNQNPRGGGASSAAAAAGSGGDRGTVRHSPAVTSILEGSYAVNQFVQKAERDRLMAVTGLSSTQIMIWFTNKRRRAA